MVYYAFFWNFECSMQQKQSQFYSKGKIYAELSNPTRLQILIFLENNPMTVSQLAKKLKKTIQALQRHVSRLFLSGLIEKSIDGKVYLTNLGKISLIQLSGYKFLLENKRYFLHHNFGDIPQSLLVRIGNLYNSKTVYGISPNIQTSKKIIKNSKEYILLILTDPPITISELIKQKLENDIPIKLLIGKNNQFSNDSEFVKILELKTKTFHKNLQKRITEFVNVNLIMNEKNCLLVLPHNEFSPDTHHSISSTNQKFHKWCSDLFRFKWDKGENFARIR